MKKLTAEFLSNAFAGESQAHIRYLIFAESAESEGFPNLSRLFKAISFAEFVHAKNHFKTLSLLKQSKDNLGVAIAGEDYEVEEMYPGFISVSGIQGESAATQSYNLALAAEKIHSALYKMAKESVDNSKDVEVGKVWICPVCGHTATSEDAPEICPVCGAKKDVFVWF